MAFLIMIRIRSFNEKKLVIEDSALVMASMFWLLFGFMTVLFALWLLTGQSPITRNPITTGITIIVVGILGVLVGASFTHVRRITIDRPADSMVIEDGNWMKVARVRKYSLHDIELAKLIKKTETVVVNSEDYQPPRRNWRSGLRERNVTAYWTREQNLYGVALQIGAEAELMALNLNYGAWESAQSVINAINEIMVQERYKNSEFF